MLALVWLACLSAFSCSCQTMLLVDNVMRHTTVNNTAPYRDNDAQDATGARG